eukprot:CAMPEP_0197027214 /NCGR_PEP_ID=MMETSP1384-20130603/7167_1 /TAXON_ID=29189 /ORGANISM="Ammonia sp." /LENGTH=149 /DNA_ID=CAMNT_0042456025 /DNA_START=58 /DNA_END=503 /DNA_ORIENTATION=+
MADADGAGNVELQEEPPRQAQQEEEFGAVFASPKPKVMRPAIVSNAAAKAKDDGLLADGVNYSHRDLIPKPWHPGDEEFDNDAERWEQVKAFGCVPRVVQGRCCGSIRYYVNPIVMSLGILVIWGFVIWCAVDAEGAGEKMGEANLWVT